MPRRAFPSISLPKDLPIELPRQSGAAQLQAALTKLELQSLPGVPERLAGTCRCRQRPRHLVPTCRRSRARSPSLTFRLRFDQLTLAQDGVSTIAIENGEARVERFDLAGSVGRLALGGHAGLAAPRPIDATAQGNVNIAAISAFTDAVRAEGAAVLDLGVTGTRRYAKPYGVS